MTSQYDDHYTIKDYYLRLALDFILYIHMYIHTDTLLLCLLVINYGQMCAELSGLTAAKSASAGVPDDLCLLLQPFITRAGKRRRKIED